MTWVMLHSACRVSSLSSLRSWHIRHYQGRLPTASMFTAQGQVKWHVQAQGLRMSPAALGEANEISGWSSLSRQQQDQLHAYLDLVMEQNKSMNLTAIRDRKEAEQMLIGDSLALLPALDKALGNRRDADVTVLDVGTGGGFPGVVLAVARYPIQVTLMDSVKKKCTFVRQATEATGILNTHVVCSRAETAAESELREAYDVVVARAVAELRVLCEFCLPFVKPGGFFLAAKGPNPQDEVQQAARALKLLGGSYITTDNVDSFGGVGQRTVVIIEKTMSTPVAYPRRDGKPKSDPL